MMEDEPAYCGDLVQLSSETSPYQTIVDGGEGIFFENDEVKGQIYTYGNHHKMEQSFLDRYASHQSVVTNVGLAVGRLFCVYTHNNKSKYYAGTAFCISPRHLITAQNVVKQKRNIDGQEFNLTSIHVDFSQEVASKHFSPNDTSLKRLRVVSKDTGGIAEQSMGGSDHWKTVNDFAFLTYEENEYKHASYCFPQFVEPGQQFNSMLVVGFPGDISKNKFLEDYTSLVQDPNKKEELFEKVRERMSGFEHKTISFGSGTVHNTPQLSTHSCPTLRGTSGGICLILEHQTNSWTLKFVGVHVGGNVSAQNNYWIPTCDKAFAHSLAKLVENCPKDFSDPCISQYIQETKTKFQ